MAQGAGKPHRIAGVIEALRTHGLREEDLTAIQTKIDPLLVEEGEVHIHVEGDDTHIHVDIHELE